jgi:hypothetical protein
LRAMGLPMMPTPIKPMRGLVMVFTSSSQSQ